MQRSRVTLIIGVFLASLIGTNVASAPSWPQRAVKFVLPLGPGSGVDISARLLGDRLSKRWGEPVVIENRPGGDGFIAITSFLGAHDDHMLLNAPTASFTAHPYMHDKLPYKATDLVPIASISSTVIGIAVPTSLNVNSFGELLAMARAQPGKLNWAGITGGIDMLLEAFFKKSGVAISKVPYRNAVDALNDLSEGRVQVYRAALAIVQPQLQTGKVKLLAVVSSARAPTEPDVPTIKEAGYPELTIDGLVGFFGTPEMPKELREKISADVRAAAVDPLIVSRLAGTGQVSKVADAAEFAEAIAEQRAKMDEGAKILGLKPAE
jgi:tripartite-type tricarboxylate transporter receptor subunit TctC